MTPNDPASFAAHRTWTLCALAFGAAVASLGLVAACSSRKVNIEPPVKTHDAGDGLDVDAAAGRRRPGNRPLRVYAAKYVVTIRNAPQPEATRIGYLRAGAIMRVKNEEPIGAQPGCLGGFFELETGGFVCNRKDVIAFEGRRPPERPPAQPDLRALLPYQYGYNRRDDTPMYRRPPTDEEAVIYEGYRIPAPAAETDGDGGLLGGGSAGGHEDDGMDAGAARAIRVAEPTEPAPSLVPDPTENVTGEVGIDAGPTTLANLMGDPNSVLMRRLVKGFYVSLDREMRFRARRYWRTLSNGFIPYARLNLVQGPTFHGVVLDGETLTLPLGFVMSETAVALAKDAATGRTRRAPTPRKRSAFHIVGEETIRGTLYFVGQDGLLYRATDVRKITAGPVPQGLGENEKWIDVDLTTQSLVAYEGTRPVYATLVSSGHVSVPGDPELDRRTPTGDYRITSKHIAATMDGDTAVDGPYSIEDVPYVMFFQLSYALHSAFWHNRFGYTKSHGCINLAPNDAKWVFAWTLPSVPLGWHGAYPTVEMPGTRVVVRGTTPGT